MIIGVPKEIKIKENRVGLTPEGVKKLIKHKHKVYIEHNAGLGSGFKDSDYIKAKAKILPNAKKIYSKTDMIIKIKEPLEKEFNLIKKNQIIFTYLHLAAEKKLTNFLLKKNVTGIAYETIETIDKKLPLLEPMSQVAGRMSVQVGAHFLEKTYGGKGILLGGTNDVQPAKVLILGYGIAGSNAAQIALGMGANVTVLELNQQKIDYINKQKNQLFKSYPCTKQNLKNFIKIADLVIGAVLIPGAKAPKLVSTQMIKTMNSGSVIVDIAIDQGGCFETSKPTSHENPVFTKYGIIHYCVTNMPGAVARTSTLALTAKTVPYAIKIANLGVIKAAKSSNEIYKGINTYKGNLTYKAVADAFNLKYNSLDKVIK